MTDFTQPAVFLETTFLFFLGIFGRYVLLCVLFQYLFKVRYKELFAQSEVNTKSRRPQQYWREIGHSLLTSVIFSLVGAGMLLAWTAALAILAVVVIATALIGMRLAIVLFASERTRWIWDAILAVIGLALLLLLF